MTDLPKGFRTALIEALLIDSGCRVHPPHPLVQKAGGRAGIGEANDRMEAGATEGTRMTIRREWRCSCWIAAPSDDHIHECVEQKWHNGSCRCECGKMFGFERAREQSNG